MSKRCAAAAERNAAAIAEVLEEVLPSSGSVLEVASGTGQHAAFFASQMPWLDWQPTDIDPGSLHSILAYQREAQLERLKRPLELDARDRAWPVAHCSAVVCINMIHIAPWQACEGLLRGAAGVLPAFGPLVLYGPFSIDGDFIAPSNVAFDRWLRAQDPAWGVRELGDVRRTAESAGLTLDRLIPMPANNHVVVFRRSERRPEPKGAKDPTNFAG